MTHTRSPRSNLYSGPAPSHPRPPARGASPGAAQSRWNCDAAALHYCDGAPAFHPRGGSAGRCTHVDRGLILTRGLGREES